MKTSNVEHTDLAMPESNGEYFLAQWESKFPPPILAEAFRGMCEWDENAPYDNSEKIEAPIVDNDMQFYAKPHGGSFKTNMHSYQNSGNRLEFRNNESNNPHIYLPSVENSRALRHFDQNKIAHDILQFSNEKEVANVFSTTAEKNNSSFIESPTSNTSTSSSTPKQAAFRLYANSDIINNLDPLYTLESLSNDGLPSLRGLYISKRSDLRQLDEIQKASTYLSKSENLKYKNEYLDGRGYPVNKAMPQYHPNGENFKDAQTHMHTGPQKTIYNMVNAGEENYNTFLENNSNMYNMNEYHDALCRKSNDTFPSHHDSVNMVYHNDMQYENYENERATQGDNIANNDPLYQKFQQKNNNLGDLYNALTEKEMAGHMKSHSPFINHQENSTFYQGKCESFRNSQPPTLSQCPNNESPKDNFQTGLEMDSNIESYILQLFNQNKINSVKQGISNNNRNMNNTMIPARCNTVPMPSYQSSKSLNHSTQHNNNTNYPLDMMDSIHVVNTLMSAEAHNLRQPQLIRNNNTNCSMNPHNNFMPLINNNNTNTNLIHSCNPMQLGSKTNKHRIANNKCNTVPNQKYNTRLPSNSSTNTSQLSSNSTTSTNEINNSKMMSHMGVSHGVDMELNKAENINDSKSHNKTPSCNESLYSLGCLIPETDPKLISVLVTLPLNLPFGTIIKFCYNNSDSKNMEPLKHEQTLSIKKSFYCFSKALNKSAHILFSHMGGICDTFAASLHLELGILYIPSHLIPVISNIFNKLKSELLPVFDTPLRIRCAGIKERNAPGRFGGKVLTVGCFIDQNSERQKYEALQGFLVEFERQVESILRLYSIVKTNQETGPSSRKRSTSTSSRVVSQAGRKHNIWRYSMNHIGHNRIDNEWQAGEDVNTLHAGSNSTLDLTIRAFETKALDRPVKEYSDYSVDDICISEIRLVTTRSLDKMTTEIDPRFVNNNIGTRPILVASDGEICSGVFCASPVYPCVWDVRIRPNPSYTREQQRKCVELCATSIMEKQPLNTVQRCFEAVIKAGITMYIEGIHMENVCLLLHHMQKHMHGTLHSPPILNPCVVPNEDNVPRQYQKGNLKHMDRILSKEESRQLCEYTSMLTRSNDKQNYVSNQPIKTSGIASNHSPFNTMPNSIMSNNTIQNPYPSTDPSELLCHLYKQSNGALVEKMHTMSLKNKSSNIETSKSPVYQMLMPEPHSREKLYSCFDNEKIQSEYTMDSAMNIVYDRISNNMYSSPNGYIHNKQGSETTESNILIQKELMEFNTMQENKLRNKGDIVLEETSSPISKKKNCILINPEEAYHNEEYIKNHIISNFSQRCSMHCNRVEESNFGNTTTHNSNSAYRNILNTANMYHTIDNPHRNDMDQCRKSSLYG